MARWYALAICKATGIWHSESIAYFTRRVAKLKIKIQFSSIS